MSYVDGKLSNRRVLVTGATGFIGGRLAERLAAEERCRVTGVGRDLHKAAFLSEHGVELKSADLQCENSIKPLLAGQDVVFHVAAWMGGSAANERERSAHAMNVEGTKMLLRAAAEAGVSRFVYVSSISAYGHFPPGIIDETHPLDTGQRDLYGRTKALAELKVAELGKQLSLDTSIVRPAMVYGPRSQQWTVGIVRRLKRGRFIVFGDGGGHAHPVFIDNLIDGMLLAAVRPEAVGEAFNLCDPTVSWRAYLSHYAQLCGRPPKYVPVRAGKILAKVKRRVPVPVQCDESYLRLLNNKSFYPFTKALTRLGYKPRVSLEEGIQRSAQWMRQTGVLGLLLLAPV